MEWRMGSSAVRKKVLRFGRKARTLASTLILKKPHLNRALSLQHHVGTRRAMI